MGLVAVKMEEGVHNFSPWASRRSPSGSTDSWAQALERIRPRLHFSGYMTGGCYTYYELKWGKYLRVDTSARFRCYALTDGKPTGETLQYIRKVRRFSDSACKGSVH